MQNYSPCAHLWECSQSGDRKIRFFLHNNRSQFPEEKIAFFLSSRLAAFSWCARGISGSAKLYTKKSWQSQSCYSWHGHISCFLHFYFNPFLSYSPVPSLQTSSSSLPSYIHSFLLILPPSIFLHLSVPSSSSPLFFIKTSSFQWSKGFLLLSNIKWARLQHYYNEPIWQITMVYHKTYHRNQHDNLHLFIYLFMYLFIVLHFCHKGLTMKLLQKV